MLNSFRFAPVLHPVYREGHVYFNLSFDHSDPRYTDIGSDEAVMLHTQYSTHWDGFPHKGSLFDANGDGTLEKVYYNGFSIVDDAGRGTQGELGATNLSIAGAAETGMQARGFAGTPSCGHCSSATRNASESASSARSKSPSSRTSVAKTRRDSVR